MPPRKQVAGLFTPTAIIDPFAKAIDMLQAFSFTRREKTPLLEEKEIDAHILEYSL